MHFADAPSLAALACEAAGEQKQFWTFHDTIFNYSGVADSAFIYNLAKSKRLNMTEFDATYILLTNIRRWIRSSIS